MFPDKTIVASGTDASSSDVAGTITTEGRGLWSRALAFSGPAYLISVGYMDPGNWSTDLAAGATLGYRLLWVLVVSNLFAILLQTLSARLGIVTGRDLAQACRDSYPKPVALTLWVLCEIAIIACDLAEVLGAAIALKLLFHLNLLAGVLLTALDTLLLLWLQRFGIRVIESIIISLIAVIAGCFLIEMFWAKPDLSPLLNGLVPRIDGSSLFLAVSILGATVMPHNLFLHSSLVQTRRIGKSIPEIGRACRYNLIDSAVALNGAMFVNAAILILAAAVFFKAGKPVNDLDQAYQLLSPLMGATAASFLFGVALLCSGQSSTITGTLAGQIVMEGFLNIRVRPWLRRLVTRSLAVIPAALVVWSSGGQGATKLILLTQVVLSAQLPFAVIPLIHFTSDSGRMGIFANKLWLRIFSWLSAALILALNIWLLFQTLSDLGVAFRFERPGASRDRQRLFSGTCSPPNVDDVRARRSAVAPQPARPDRDAPGYGRRIGRSPIQADSGHTGSLSAGSDGAGPRVSAGSSASGGALSAPRGRRCHQSGLRGAFVYRGGGSGSRVSRLPGRLPQA